MKFRATIGKDVGNYRPYKDPVYIEVPDNWNWQWQCGDDLPEQDIQVALNIREPQYELIELGDEEKAKKAKPDIVLVANPAGGLMVQLGEYEY